MGTDEARQNLYRDCWSIYMQITGPVHGGITKGVDNKDGNPGYFAWMARYCNLLTEIANDSCWCRVYFSLFKKIKIYDV